MEIAEEGMIRRYLLGQLAEDERQQLEERIMTDTELFNRTLLAEDELVDEYVKGELSGGELKGFEDSFLSTPEGRKQISFAKALGKYVSSASTATGRVAGEQAQVSKTHRPVWWSRPALIPYFRLAAAAVIVLGFALGIWRVFFYQSEVSKGLAALAAAYREQRPLEARISGLSYAPVASTRGEKGKADQVALDRAERILLDAVYENPGPASHHALGKLYLAEQQFDKAIAQFEEALKADPNNAQFHSDYGSALMEKGKVNESSDQAGKGLEELARALEEFTKALELDGNLLEALFNRALCRQYLMLPRQAEEDWRVYLEKDSTSKWAEEARRYLALLEEKNRRSSWTREEILQDFMRAYEARDEDNAWRIISRSREALSRKLIWEQLLDAYLEAAKEPGQMSDAVRNLQALSYAGELEYRKAGDRYTSGLAGYYGSLSDNQRDLLAGARRSMALGHQYYSQYRMGDARDSYNRAKQTFDHVGDEWESQYAQHWIGYSYYEQGKTQQGLLLLEQLARSLQKESYQWLLMRTLHLLSSANHNLNEYSKAINYNRSALSLAERIGDTIGIFNASSILIFQYGSTGNYHQALDYVQKSLSIMDDCPLNEIQFARQYTIVALAFSALGLYHAAIDYEKEALRRALALGHIQHVSTDYAHLGLMYGKLGNFSEALRNLEFAYRAAESHSDEVLRKELKAFASLQAGHLYREQGDLSNAISRYGESIALGDHFHFQYAVYEAHKNRLFCYLALGDDPSIGEELQTTLALAEQYRSTILEGDNRNSFFDIEQSVYDLAIDFAYSRLNDSRKAFQFSEDSRSRSLLDSVSGNAGVSADKKAPDITFTSVSRPLTLTEIQERLPGQAQILQYAVLSNKLLIWVISKTQFSTLEKVITQRDLTRKVSDYLRVICSPNGTRHELDSDGKELFEILIRPAASLLDRNNPVYLVPDKVLTSLPFSALVSTESDKYLFEEYLLEVSPSSSLLVICSEIAARKDGTRVERLLSVGNPRFDRNKFPSLTDLPSATREAEQVAAYYGSSRLLVDEAATRDQVRNEMLKSDVIHLALHCVVDERSPMRSRLILAKDSGWSNLGDASDGSLQAHEIYQLKLPKTRLAVLSACQTGAERYFRGEGMICLARPFVAAGVPIVIVSLWPVDSDSTSELMISFHKHRKQDNLSSAEALRRAQLEMLHRPEERFNRPFCWGAFVQIGGNATF